MNDLQCVCIHKSKVSNHVFLSLGFWHPEQVKPTSIGIIIVAFLGPDVFSLATITT